MDSSLVGYDGDQNVRNEDRKVDQEQKPRERSFIRELVPNWRRARGQVLWAVTLAVVVLLGVFLLLYVISFLFGKTVWDVLKVLAVPITIGAAVPLLNWLQKTRELEVENQRAQDEALQAYLDQMSQLLVDKERPLHRAQLGDSLSTVARTLTLSVLPRLDGERKRSVLLFLSESNLIAKERPIVALAGADLHKASLYYMYLIGTNLSST